MDEGLAGAMFWSMDYDDFTGQYCDDGAYPLLRRVKAVLSGAPGKHQQMLMRCVCVCVCVCVCACVCVCVCVCVFSLVCMVGVIYVYVDTVFGFMCIFLTA